MGALMWSKSWNCTRHSLMRSTLSITRVKAARYDYVSWWRSTSPAAYGAQSDLIVVRFFNRILRLRLFRDADA